MGREGGVVQAGENKNTLIYRAYSAVIVDGLRGDGDESIKEVIKKVQCSFFILIDWCRSWCLNMSSHGAKGSLGHVGLGLCSPAQCKWLRL